MIIRQAEEKDFAKIIDLLKQVLDIHAQIRPDIFIADTTKYSFADLTKITNDPTQKIFVAEEEEVIGYVFIQVQETTGQNMQPITTVYIDDLCVDKNHRSNHVGQKLLAHVKTYAKSIHAHNVTLHVWEGNTSAKRFYEKEGFGVQKSVLETIVDEDV